MKRDHRTIAARGAYLAYRILDTGQEKDDFIYDVQQNGLMLGFGIRL